MLQKYDTIEKLNSEWNSNVWSTKYNSFEDVIKKIDLFVLGQIYNVLDKSFYLGERKTDILKEKRRVFL